MKKKKAASAPRAPNKRASKKPAPKKRASKKAAPKKRAPKKRASKKSAPKKRAPKKSAPKKAAPKKAAPKKAAPKKAAPKSAAPTQVGASGAREPIAAVAFSRDGSRLAVSLVRSLGGKESGHVVVYDVTGAAVRRVAEASIPGGGVEILAMSPNGSFVAAGRRKENGVQLIDARTGALAHTLIVRGATALAFAPDGQRLAVGSYNADEAASRVVVLDAKGGAELFRSTPLRQPVVSLAFLDDGLVLVGALDHWGALVAWDVDAGKELFRLPEFDEPPARRGRAAASSLDGLAFATCDGSRVDVWAVDRQERTTLDVGSVPQNIALNRDGSILLVGSPDSAAWSVGSGARLATLDGPGLVAVHPDNQRALLCSSIDPQRGPTLFSLRDALFPTGTIE